MNYKTQNRQVKIIIKIEKIFLVTMLQVFIE